MKISLDCHRPNDSFTFQSKYGRKATFEEIKQLHQEGFSNKYISKYIGKPEKLISLSLKRAGLVPNTLANSKCIEEKIMYFAEFNLQNSDIAFRLKLPEERVNYIISNNMDRKARVKFESHIVELFDNGAEIDEISSKTQLSPEYVKKVLNRHGRHIESWLRYTTQLKDKTLGVIANRLKIPLEELSKYIKL